MAHRLFIASLLAATAGGSLCACGDGACGDNPASGGGNAPRVRNFQLRSQLPSDPWTVVLSADFEDSDGDLSGGSAQFFLNESSNPSTTQSLGDVFRQSALADDATQGTLAMPLRFGDTVQDGSEVNLGLQLVDAAAHRSNCYKLTLDFKVRSALLRWRYGAQRLASLL